MAYTINQGYHEDRRLDWLQRGLIIGLPVLALILSFGAFRHNGSPSSTASQNPKLIPIISSLSGGSGSSTKNNNSGSSSLNGGGSSTGSTPSSSSLSGATGTTSGSTITSSGTTPIVGGRGGGPTGGTSGTGGSTGGSGGPVVLPDCSLNQIATVTCNVTTCSPEVTLQPGQKAIAGLDGTCAVVN